MPVEIKELVIRITNTNASTSGIDSSMPSAPHTQEAIVEACVKQVLKILEKKQKR